MLSNSSAPAIDAIYRQAAAGRAGLALWEGPARRAINSRPGGQGPVQELLLTNVAPRLETAAPTGLRRGA